MALKYLASISHYIPELLLCLTMAALIVIESAYDKNVKGSAKGMLFSAAFIGLLSSFVLLVKSLGQDPLTIFTGAVVIDSFSGLAKIIMVLGTAAAIYLAKQSRDIYEEVKAEFVILAIGILIGGMLLSSANNMLVLYIGVETLSILSYVMAAIKKNDERSSEAGLKYVLYGGVTAAIMLFGMSHIFGVLGTIQFSEIYGSLGNLTTAQTAILMPSFIMFFAGIGYKIACVPFHMWSPDVYEGAPLPVTNFFSIVPKIAGIVVIVRVTNVFFAGNESVLRESWTVLLMLISALTMTVGNVAAIGQRSVKRMLAYSSISHAGVMLLGVVVMDSIGTRAIMFYAITYLFMTTVAFYITSFVQDHNGNDHFERFNGLIYKHPLMSVAMALVMFSLAGLPPLSGFVAKFNILSAIISKKYYVLAVIAGFNSVISLYYYLKVVKFMVFREVESDEPVVGLGFSNQLLITVFSVPVVMLGIFWEKILLLADGAKIFLQ